MKDPKITVVIPLGKKRENLVLDSLKKQKDKVKIITEFGPSPSENRNRGLRKAKTELVAFMNGHTIAPKNWSEKVIVFFSEYPDADIVGGPQLTPPNDSNFGRISGYALSSPFGAGGVYNRYSGDKIIFNADENHLTSANLICKRKVFKKIKFDENLYPGEDPKFIEDAKKSGFNVIYSPDIMVYNKRRGSFKELSKQILYYGKVRTKKEKLNNTINKPHFLIPSLFLIYLLFLPILININLLFISPLACYFLLSLLFSFYEALKNKDAAAIIYLPAIFLTIHLSYGAGFLYGFFYNRIKK